MRRASAARSTCSRTTPTRPATPTAATRTTSTERDDDFAHYTEVLIPFLVSRQIYAGAGKMLHTAKGRLSLPLPARRAHLGGRVVGHHPSRAHHQHPRRPHADAERFRRLHVIVGDSNMSEYATFLKVGATSILLHPARGQEPVLSGPDPREPDPGHPRDHPGHHPPRPGSPGQRPGGLRPRDPDRVPREGPRLPRQPGPAAPTRTWPSTCGPRPSTGLESIRCPPRPHATGWPSTS